MYLVAMKRIELFYPAYETCVLPLNYIAIKNLAGMKRIELLMTVSKTVALPLGDIPINIGVINGCYPRA